MFRSQADVEQDFQYGGADDHQIQEPKKKFDFLLEHFVVVPMAVHVRAIE